MSIIRAIEHERCAYRGSDPAQLRQRMIERDSEHDADILTALYRMDDEDRWQALQLLSDEDVTRLFSRMNE
jgi:hypothetical protein